MGLHLRDRRADAREERARHDGMADVQLVQVREREDGADVVVVDAVARVDHQPEPVRVLAPGAQARQFRVRRRAEPGVGEGAGVQLDDGRADGVGGVDLGGLGTDEQGDFDAGVALSMLETEKATHAYPCFVTIMQDLIEHPKFSQTDLSSVRLMNANLGVQPDWIRDSMVKAMPHTIMVGTYGLTEGSGTICTSRTTDPWEARGWRLGVPLDEWEVQIVDIETGAICGCDEKGEIIARGPNMLAGYYNAPEKTAEVIDADGWFHTGDIGSFDAQGQIMFHGRTKDMMKVGGENVAAAEIEAALQTHPAVKLAQVTGIPHPRYVEVPAAFVELNDGKSASEAELIAHCTGKLASFKLPRHVRFVSEWPMSTSKIQKFRLRDTLVTELNEA